MIVNYFGKNCFRLQSGEVSLLIDPDNNRLKADATLKTLVATAPDVLAEDLSSESLISFPGEYEVKGMEITGFGIPGESTEKFLKTAYVVNWEEMKFVFLGYLSHPIDATLMEEFADPDVLFLPIDGGHFLEPEIAAKIAKQLEARIIIPSFSKKTDDFLKALGKKAESVEKFVFKRKDIATEKGKPIIIANSD
jgi:L-ascorbate metabolism protein UlaG (beta-lactamase superfamily)